MNYLGPRQRQEDMRWDYTCANRRTGTYGVGYCRAWKPFEPASYMTAEMCENENKKFEPFLSKFHTTGHATQDEACACYKDYLLDHEMWLGTMSGQQRQCQVCQTWTQTFVEVGTAHLFVLCEQHSGRDEVVKLFEVGECWCS
jgi:hypothetical protein